MDTFPELLYFAHWILQIWNMECIKFNYLFVSDSDKHKYEWFIYVNTITSVE